MERTILGAAMVSDVVSGSELSASDAVTVSVSSELSCSFLAENPPLISSLVDCSTGVCRNGFLRIGSSGSRSSLRGPL